MATGEYPVRVPRPYVSGQEAVGVVEDASPSLSHLVGKRVVAFTPQPFGSFAPRCVGTAPTVWECPEELSDEEGAAFLIASHTAYHAVHRRGGVREHECDRDLPPLDRLALGDRIEHGDQLRGDVVAGRQPATRQRAPCQRDDAEFHALVEGAVEIGRAHV